MRFQAGRFSAITKQIFSAQGILPPQDYIFLRKPHGVNVVANELMFLWEIKLKDRGVEMA